MHAYTGRRVKNASPEGEQHREPTPAPLLKMIKKFLKEMNPQDWNDMNEPPVQHMVHAFMETLGDKTPEQWLQEQKDLKAQNRPRRTRENKGIWKKMRGTVQAKPEGVIEVAPGQTKAVEIQVLNDTHFPWKAGYTVGLAGEQPEA